MKHKYVLLIRTIMIDLIYKINVRTFIHNAVKLKRIEGRFMKKPAYKEKYPNLFTPFSVERNGHVVNFKNRILVPPQGYCNTVEGTGLFNEDAYRWYERYAYGGFASYCVAQDVPKGQAHQGMLELTDRSLYPYMYLRLLANSTHAFNCNLMVEILHPGVMQITKEDGVAMGPSAIMVNGHMTREMNEDDMYQVADMFGELAITCKQGGVDGLCLHFGHGWLLSNFLSPLSNHRKDKYGGSLENRCRFPLMVINRIREMAGDDTIIELRLNAHDGYKEVGGITPEDAVQQALFFQDHVEMIHFSCGNRLSGTSRGDMHPTGFVPHGHNAIFSEMAKKAGVKIPVGVVGAINDPVLAEKIIADGQADYVYVSRQAEIEPNFVNKLIEGREEDIRPCLQCGYCTDAGRRTNLTNTCDYVDLPTFDVACVIDPFARAGSRRRRVPKADRKMRVAVVGGGIAGLNAAIRAAEQGHEVFLFEKGDHLGGQIALFCDHLWFKHRMRNYIDYLEIQAKKHGVEIRMNQAADAHTMEVLNPDAVIVAVGGEQIVPRIPGIDSKNVVMAWDIFGNEEKLGKNVVIIGGGMVGCEIAISLGEKGRKCQVFEMGEYLAVTAQLGQRQHLFQHMDDNGVEGFTNSTCTKITDEGVWIKDAQGEEKFYQADNVIICTGTKPLAKERDQFEDTAMYVIPVGDCLHTADIRNAVHTAWDAASSLGISAR